MLERDRRTQEWPPERKERHRLAMVEVAKRKREERERMERDGETKSNDKPSKKRAAKRKRTGKRKPAAGEIMFPIEAIPDDRRRNKVSKPRAALRLDALPSIKGATPQQQLAFEVVSLLNRILSS